MEEWREYGYTDGKTLRTVRLNVATSEQESVMPEYEYAVREFAVDDKLPEVLRQLEAEGWKANPCSPPKAVYHLIRTKGGESQPQQSSSPPPTGGFGDLIIDDTKIFVVPSDQLK